MLPSLRQSRSMVHWKVSEKYTEVKQGKKKEQSPTAAVGFNTW